MGFFRRDREPAVVTNSGAGRSFPAPGKDSLLNEALAAGIPFPHNCTVGTCRSRPVSGKVRELTDSAIALTSEELRQRFVLPCQSLARGPVELDVAGLRDMPDHPFVHTAAEMTGRRALTHDILEITVRVDEPFDYSGGQYAELAVPGMSRPRSYSFATARADGPKDELTFFVRRTPGGEFTEWLFAEDRTGTGLAVSGPFGSLYLRPSEVPVLCVAGGSGLAPIKALLEGARDDGVRREVVVVFGARAMRDMYCLDLAESPGAAWGDSFTFVAALSEEAADSGWDGARGLVTDVLAEMPTELLTTCDAYVCGPPAMVDAVERELQGRRTGSGWFHADRFLDKLTQRQGSVRPRVHAQLVAVRRTAASRSTAGPSPRAGGGETGPGRRDEPVGVASGQHRGIGHQLGEVGQELALEPPEQRSTRARLLHERRQALTAPRRAVTASW